jgi:histidine triad (HIT) family protein
VLDEKSDCEFCKIIRGDAPARVVCETEDSIAFFPLKPAARGHTLVVPRRHVEDIWSVDPGLASRIIETVLKASHALRIALKPDGLNVINSAGEAASQTVCHLHIHLVPRWYNDHIGNIWPPQKPWQEELLNDIAEDVRAACSGLSL